MDDSPRKPHEWLQWPVRCNDFSFRDSVLAEPGLPWTGSPSEYTAGP